MIASIGGFYFILGMLLHILYRPQTFEPSKSVLRIKKHFIAVGVFNIGLDIIAIVVPIDAFVVFSISAISVGITMLLVALESFDTYQRILNKLAI